MWSIYACLRHNQCESQARWGWWQHRSVFHAREISLCQYQSWPFHPGVWSCLAQAAGYIWAAPSLQPEFVQRLGTHCQHQFGPRSLHNVSVNSHQELTQQPPFFPMSDSITCASGFQCSQCPQVLCTSSCRYTCSPWVAPCLLGIFGKIMLKFRPLSCFLDTPELWVLAFCICNTGLVFSFCPSPPRYGVMLWWLYSRCLFHSHSALLQYGPLFLTFLYTGLQASVVWPDKCQVSPGRNLRAMNSFHTEWV